MKILFLVAALIAAITAPRLCAQSSIVYSSFDAAVNGGTIEIAFSDLVKEDSKTHLISFGDGSKGFDPARTLMFYEDVSGRLVQLHAKIVVPPGVTFVIQLMNFTDLAGAPVSLLQPGKALKYTIILRGKGDADEFTTQVDVKDPNSPPLAMTLQADDDKSSVRNRSRLVLQLRNDPASKDAEQLYQTFKDRPSHVVLKYGFAPDDYVPDRITQASSLPTFTANAAFNSNTGTIDIVPKGAFPLRPKPYKIEVQFPVSDMSAELASRLVASPNEKFVSAGTKVTFSPAKVDRATSVFYFETTLSSTVVINSAKNTKSRQNTGVFALHWKPVVKLLSWNIQADQQPFWGALRPVLESDIDTLPLKTSKSPNKTTFGLDFDLGRVSKDSRGGLVGTSQPALLQELIVTNGLRFDSDRDFKVITAYWHTEVTPRLLDFEQTQDQRIWRYKFAHSSEKPGTFPKEPKITAYKFQPSTGYDLGTVTRRAGPVDPVLGDSVSRFFVKIDSSVEFARFLTFGAVDTSYYLPPAKRRSFRGYLESRIELNSGSLFRTEAFGLQNAIVFKFQRGEQPPTYKPVNTLSLGFKIYQ